MNDHENPEGDRVETKKDLTSMGTFLVVNMSECCFSISIAINQYATNNLGLSVLEFAFARNFVNFWVSTSMLYYKGMSPLQGITSDVYIPLGIRCIVGNIAFISLTYVFSKLPLSIGTVIISTSPFAVAILSRLILAEDIARPDIIAIIVSFTGILIMAVGATA